MKQMIFGARKTYRLVYPLCKSDRSLHGSRPNFVDNCRKLYLLKLGEVYTAYLLEKGNRDGSQLCREYIDYLDAADRMSGERDLRRCATTEQKERLPDRCVGCNGESSLNSHHIVPYSNGGPTEIWNLTTLCGTCHDLVPDVQLFLYRKMSETEIDPGMMAEINKMFVSESR